METKYTSVLLTGRPGSGKGTQAKVLAEKFGWVNFSTGNTFKALRDEESTMGARVRAVYDFGQLMPDWFATYLFEDVVLKLSATDGIVCEGYPRSLAQAEIFDDIMTWLKRPYVVLDLVVSEEEAMRRMLERAKVEHRPDATTEEQIRVRFATYEASTKPILDFFRTKNTLVEIDGEQTPDEVRSAIERALAA